MFNWIRGFFEKISKKSTSLETRHIINASLNLEIESLSTRKEQAAKYLNENRYAEALVLYEALNADHGKDTTALLGRAFVYEQLQQYEKAEECVLLVLHLNPNDADAIYLLTKIFTSTGRAEQALVYFEKLLTIAPNFEVAYCDYSFCLFQNREIDKAIYVIEKGLKEFPREADFYLIRGNLKLEKKFYAEAVLDFELAISLVPISIEANEKLALANFSLCDWEKALRSFDRVLELDAKNIVALVYRGKILFLQNRHDEAIESFDGALKVMPNCVEALWKKGVLLSEKKKFEEALTSFDCALKYANENADLWADKSALLIDMKQFLGALGCAEQALRFESLHLNAMLNKCAALLGLNQLEEATPVIDKVLEIAPGNEIAFWQRARVHQRFNEHEMALFNFYQALKFQPEFDVAHYDQGFSFLASGQLSIGWKKYEYRWKCAPHLMENRNFKTPYWDGKSSLAGKTLLIFYEAGYGDTIQFVRYFKMFAGLGCKLIFQTQPPLKKLLSNFDPNVLVVAAHETLPAFDTQIALMSLPLVFNTTLETIPAEEKYLDAEHALPGVVSRWRENILNNGRKKIGLVWSGNPVHQQDTSRSISSEQFLRLVSDEFYFACLQKDIRPVDRSFLVLEKRVVEFSADLTDFVETAGLITNMDLVITVDTSIAHLAGALGKPVWVLLPFNADWRWLLNRSDSPWYPSMTLFRQKEIGNWDQVLDEVSARLKELR